MVARVKSKSDPWVISFIDTDFNTPVPDETGPYNCILLVSDVANRSTSQGKFIGTIVPSEPAKPVLYLIEPTPSKTILYLVPTTFVQDLNIFSPDSSKVTVLSGFNVGGVAPDQPVNPLLQSPLVTSSDP